MPSLCMALRSCPEAGDEAPRPLLLLLSIRGPPLALYAVPCSSSGPMLSQDAAVEGLGVVRVSRVVVFVSRPME